MSCKVILLALIATVVLVFTTLSLSSPSSLPTLPRITTDRRRNMPRTFSEHREFYDLSRAGDANWTALLPPNGGFVVQKLDGRRSRMAGVTMFHQLHCLQMIRGAIQDLREENTKLSSRVRARHLDHDDVDAMKGGVPLVSDGFEKEHKHKQVEGEERPPQAEVDDGGPSTHRGGHDSMHWVHCLDYLMQGILCAADDTIEAAEDGEGRLKVDGYGITHMCRDPDEVWHMARGPMDHSPYP